MQLTPPSSGLASTVIFVSASIWGLYWMPLRYLEGLGVDGAWSVALVNLPAAILLAIVTLWQWRAHRPALIPMLLIGFFTGTALALYASGLLLSSVVRATLLFYLVPVWATLIGVFWLRERAAWQRWAAISAGIFGMLMLMSGGGSVPLNIGDLFGLLSGIFWAIGAALIVRHPNVPVPGMTMMQFACCAAMAILIGVLTRTAVPTPPPAEVLLASAPMAAGVSILALMPAVLAIFWAQKFLFPGRVGLLMMSEVLMAVISASLLLPEESLSPLEWFGAALILGACLAEVIWTPQQAPGEAARAA